MIENFSKPIQKTDDSAKQLIIEALEGQETGGFDLDSVYNIQGTYYVLEFLKCDTVRPFNSHPRRYWFKKWEPDYGQLVADFVHSLSKHFAKYKAL